MSKRRRVVSPRIVVPHHGVGLWFLVVVLVLTSIAGAFFIGAFLAREEAKTYRGMIHALEQERNQLNEQLVVLKQEQIVLKRTTQVDQETSRAAQENLKAAQDERLVLEKQVSFLKRLIREGGGGLLKVHDFLLTPSEEERVFKYSFTVSQMIQGFGESAGSVAVKLAGKRDGKEVLLGVDELVGSTPDSHKLRFKHFQSIEGTLKIPEDLDPETLLIEIEPTTKKLIPISETYPWKSGE